MSSESDKNAHSAYLPQNPSLDPKSSNTELNQLNQDHALTQEKIVEPTSLSLKIFDKQNQSPHLKEEDILLSNKASLKRHEDTDSSAICRVCFDSGAKSLISPCKCSGSSKFIHEDCLLQWLQSIEVWTSDQFPKCELCKSKYEAIFYFKKIVSKDKCSKVTKQLVFAAVILIFLCAAISVTIFTIVQAIKKYDEQKKLTFAEGLIIGSFVIVIILLIANYCRIKKKMYDKELSKWRILNYSETLEFTELDKTDHALGKVITPKIEYPYIFFKNYEIVK